MTEIRNDLPISDITWQMDLSVPPVFLDCGCFVAPEGWIHRERIMDCHELLMGLRGTIGLEEDGFSRDLGPLDMLFFRQGHRHRGTGPAGAGDSFFWVHFREAAVPADEGRKTSLPCHVRGSDTPRCRMLMHQLQDCAADPGSPPDLAGWLCGALLLELVRSGGAGGKDGAGAQWFRHLLSWAELHLDHPLQVEDLARQAGRHPDHVTRTFRRHLDITPLDWLHRQRLERARRLLQDTDMSVKEVASACGFTGSRQFIRNFRERECLGPGEWRNMHCRIRFNKE